MKKNQEIIYGSYNDHYYGNCKCGYFIRERIYLIPKLIAEYISLKNDGSLCLKVADLVIKRQWIKDAETGKEEMLVETIAHFSDDRWAEKYNWSLSKNEKC